jgi:hypothetical protein
VKHNRSIIKTVPLLFAFALISLFSALTLISVGVAYAQGADETTTINFEGTSKAESSYEASREIQSKALTETAREQTIEMIGEKRYQKSKSLVESRIVREAAKFIPFVNPGQPQQQADGSWKMSVELRLSAASLRKMILDAGLLNDAEGPASILPLIAFTDRKKGVSVHWWLGEPKDEAHKFLVERSRAFHEVVQKEFAKQGFYVLRPQGLHYSILPEALRAERPSLGDLKQIGEYHQTPMILTGEVRIRDSRELTGAYQCSVKLQVVQASGGRTIGEVSRTFETDAGNFESVVRAKLGAEMPEIAKDLAVQVLEVWQRGTLNTNVVRVAVRGQLNPRQLQDFKSGILKSVKDVKSLKERLFEPGQVIFEADLSGQVTELSERLKTLEIPGFQVKLAESLDKSLVLDVKAQR